MEWINFLTKNDTQKAINIDVNFETFPDAFDW